MGVKFIDHIAIAVKEPEKFLELFYDMGFKLDGVEVVESQGVRVFFLSPPEGQTRIELVEPLHSKSPVSKFLEKSGEKIHHICLRTEDIRTEMTRLREKGYEWIHTVPVPGADGAEIAFIHPRSTCKILLEWKQKGESF